MPYKFTQHETIYQPYKMEDQWIVYTGCSSPPINISSEGTCAYNHVCACCNTYSGMSGGAVCVTGNATVTISNSVFDCNTAGSCGGAVNVTRGNVTISGSGIINNCACCHGGGVAVEGGDTFGLSARTESEALELDTLVMDEELVVEEAILEPEPIEEEQADELKQVEPEPEQVEPKPESEPEPIKEIADEPNEPESEPEPTADTSVGEEVHNEGDDTGEQEASEVSTTKARVAKEPKSESEPVAEEEEEPDMINPSITITLGEDEPAIGVAMPITIIATDNVAITNITCTINGKKKRAQMSTGKGTPIATSTYTFTPEEAGDYTVIATATDKAGNAIEASEVIAVAEDKDTETINFNAGLE